MERSHSPFLVFITGGVVSSLGKGVATASLAALLQARGFSVTVRKSDPYLNVDSGTLNPYQHGECFVTADGAEADMDLGHYERFADLQCSKKDTITAGRVYLEVLSRERSGKYLGSTVQVIPHVTDVIKEMMTCDVTTDFLLCELGGTIGDIEGLPFVEAVRQLRYGVGRGRCVHIHVTLLPYITSAGELKTKPTQHSVHALQSLGIQPHILLCRTSSYPLSLKDREKLALYCNIQESCVVPAPDVDNIYDLPLVYGQNGLDEQVLCILGKNVADYPLDLTRWNSVHEKISRLTHVQEEVKILIVGKYVVLPDAYKSLTEALMHASLGSFVRVNLCWIDAEDLEKDSGLDVLKDADGILVPGGFGERGLEGKMRAIRFARENKIPFLGICLGMQMAVLEAVRSLLGYTDAVSEEMVGLDCARGYSDPKSFVVMRMALWLDHHDAHYVPDENFGGTMRLGNYRCSIAEKSLAFEIYQTLEINERHRHRYEINTLYIPELESCGMHFSGYSTGSLALPEIVEYKDHPWFLGVQFHPEYNSRPFSPHPIFVHYLQASWKYACKKKYK